MALQVVLSHGTPIRSRHSTVCNRNSGAHLRLPTGWRPQHGRLTSIGVESR
jgi:hypothetical protein